MKGKEGKADGGQVTMCSSIRLCWSEVVVRRIAQVSDTI